MSHRHLPLLQVVAPLGIPYGTVSKLTAKISKFRQEKPKTGLISLLVLFNYFFFALIAFSAFSFLFCNTLIKGEIKGGFCVFHFFIELLTLPIFLSIKNVFSFVNQC